MRNSLFASIAGAGLTLAVVAFPIAEAAATPPKPPVVQRPISQPALQGNLIRQRSEAIRAAANRATEQARKADASNQSGATSGSTTD